jgi:hypothetical protein
MRKRANRAKGARYWSDQSALIARDVAVRRKRAPFRRLQPLLIAIKPLRAFNPLPASTKISYGAERCDCRPRSKVTLGGGNDASNVSKDGQ